MKAKGIFMYKGIQDRKAGEFINKETGEVINYEASKILVCDELDGLNNRERRFKLPKSDTQLLSNLISLEPYTRIELTFDVSLYSANAKLTPESFELA